MSFKTIDKRTTHDIPENSCKHELISDVTDVMKICILCGELFEYFKRCKQWVPMNLDREARFRCLRVFEVEHARRKEAILGQSKEITSIDDHSGFDIPEVRI